MTDHDGNKRIMMMIIFWSCNFFCYFCFVVCLYAILYVYYLFSKLFSKISLQFLSWKCLLVCFIVLKKFFHSFKYFFLLVLSLYFFVFKLVYSRFTWFFKIHRTNIRSMITTIIVYLLVLLVFREILLFCSW